MLALRPNQKVLTLPGYGMGVLEAPVPAPWWEVAGKTCVAAYQPKGAASYAASKVNLANPGTYNVTSGLGDPTWGATDGWQFNGTQWLQTGVTATNSLTWLIRYANHGATTMGGIFGVEDTGNAQIVMYPNLYGMQFKSGGALTILRPDDWAAGVGAASPEYGYWNGTSKGALADPLSGSTAHTIPIGANYGRVNDLYYTQAVNILAFALYSATLTAEEIATVSAAMAAL